MALRLRGQVVAGAIALAACSVSGCSAGGSPSPDGPYADITSATPTIQAAAEAIVLVVMPGFAATASFISPSGLLLTNNHVLGVGVCPVEGCHAKLTWDYQRGQPLQQPVDVFLVPQAVDVGLDMAILQASAARGAPPLSTPNYLTIDSREPAALQGTHVTVIGHPEASVKKWTAGEVIYADGAWVTTSAPILPGNSGSPLLDDHGHLVGLMHRSPDGEDLVTDNGLNASSIGTASSAIIGAMSAPLPASMWSVTAAASEADVVSHELLYRTASMPTALVDGAPEPVLTALGAACDAALAVGDYASPEDLTSGLSPCTEAKTWIECRGDATTTGYCPPDTSAWRGRYEAIFEYWRKFNGSLELDDVSFAPAALESSMAVGQQAGAAALSKALGEANPALDFHVASYLAAFGVATYRGASVLDFAGHYTAVPDYAADGVDLVNTIFWLGSTSTLDLAEVRSLLGALHADRTVDLETKLFIEQGEYNWGILP